MVEVVAYTLGGGDRWREHHRLPLPLFGRDHAQTLEVGLLLHLGLERRDFEVTAHDGDLGKIHALHHGELADGGDGPSVCDGPLDVKVADAAFVELHASLLISGRPSCLNGVAENPATIAPSLWK